MKGKTDQLIYFPSSTISRSTWHKTIVTMVIALSGVNSFSISDGQIVVWYPLLLNLRPLRRKLLGWDCSAFSDKYYILSLTVYFNAADIWALSLGFYVHIFTTCIKHLLYILIPQFCCSYDLPQEIQYFKSIALGISYRNNNTKMACW